MDEAFDARFQFHKRAVRHEVDDLAFDLGADLDISRRCCPTDWLSFCLRPRLTRSFSLLMSSTTTSISWPTLRISDGCPMRPQLMSVMWSRPSMPLRSMNAPKSVMFLTVPLRMSPGVISVSSLAALVVALLLDQFAARKDDVLALLVDFDDLEFVGVADELRQVLRRDDVNLRRGQKRFDADVDEQAAFDDGLDLAGDGAAFVANGEDFVPVLLELGLFLGEDDHAFLVFEFFDEDIDFIADFDGFDVVKFVAGDDAFAFVADIDEDFLGADFDDGAFDDLACGKARRALLHGFFHCEHNNNVYTMNCGRLGGARSADSKTPLPT